MKLEMGVVHSALKRNNGVCCESDKENRKNVSVKRQWNILDGLETNEGASLHLPNF